MGERNLIFHTGNRLEVLGAKLAETLHEHPLPACEEEIIVVQSQGMARWLALFLAARHGICAGTSTPFPQTFIHSLAARLEDEEQPAAHRESAFGRDALTWRIFSDMAGWQNEPVFAPAAGYLAADTEGRKRYQLARRLADLFDNYQLFRPDMLGSWEQSPDAAVAGLEGHVHVGWQAHLWSRLVSQTDEPSLATRLTSLLDRLENGDTTELAPLLPARVSIFGVSTLPPVFLQLLSALSRSIPVTLYYVSPTAEYWADVRPAREVERIRDRIEAAGADAEDAHAEEGNPLLASMGRLGRDFFAMLQNADHDGTAWQPLDFESPTGSTALHTVQRDIIELDPGDSRVRLAEDDDSIVIDCCHSPMREMEVLRDRILDAFARDPELRPDDVLVLVTDIGRYAPYIEAVFGSREPDLPRIPFSIADRSPVEDAAPIKAVIKLMELASGRFEAGAVIDLLEMNIVRRRFAIRADELGRLREWVDTSGIRWGINAAWRGSELGIEPMEANSWQFGIDRMLMGYAVGDCPALVAGIAPSPAAALQNAELLGRFTTFTETLFAEHQTLRKPATASIWAATIRRTCDLFLHTEPEDETALADLRRAIDDLASHAEASGLDEEISAAIVRGWLTDSLSQSSRGSGFINGRITFCELKPMRTIPFRLVCVSGLDDEAFPRRDRPAGYDLIAAAPRAGDRSLRDDDRYLFLETLLAAGERLVLTYAGRSLTDTNERAPSVVVSELHDYLDRRFASEDDVRPSAMVTVNQRMHPYDSHYFREDSGRLFSYSSENREVAAAAGEPSLRAPSPAEVRFELREHVDLTPYELAEFWLNPSKIYVTSVLGLRLREFDDETTDVEPITLDNLQQYALKQAMLDRRVRGQSATDVATSVANELEWMRACGELPLGGFGSATHESLKRDVDLLAARVGRIDRTETISVAIKGNGWSITGTIEDEINTAGERVRYRCAKLKPADQVRAWIYHVVACVAAAQAGATPPPRTLIALKNKTSCEDIPFAPLGAEQAGEFLEQLAQGYRRGMARPLPLFPGCAKAYVEATQNKNATAEKIEDAVRKAWEGSLFSRGDRADPHIEYCFRDTDALKTFAEDFRELAEFLWSPILEQRGASTKRSKK